MSGKSTLRTWRPFFGLHVFSVGKNGSSANVKALWVQFGPALSAKGAIVQKRLKTSGVESSVWLVILYVTTLTLQ